MPEITFKRETSPARCEICHQADLFDMENSRCVRCDILSVRQMVQVANAAVIPTIASPVPPALWRFNNTASVLLAALIFAAGVFLKDFFGSPKVVLVFMLLSVVGYFGSVSLDALIKYALKWKIGTIPHDIERLFDEWLGLSIGLTFLIDFFLPILICIFLSFIKNINSINQDLTRIITTTLLIAPLLAMLLSLLITFKTRRHVVMKIFRVEQNTAL
jgi:hypothetical protein